MDQVRFDGILSRHPSQNPDFYNWNRVQIRYCDGASFAGNPESEFKNGTELFFRGQLIWEAIMNELLSLGLSEEKQALLSGCSTGGLATFIHCDNFRDHLPQVATVKCVADAGFFLNEPDVLGIRTILAFYHDVVTLQGVAKNLGKNCVGIMEPFKAVPVASDPQGYWSSCRLSIQKCDSTQIKRLQGFRDSMLEVLSMFQENKEGGMFINSCFAHCLTVMDTWHSPHSPRINNKTIAESVGDWYFGRKVSKQIDRPYPCNPTCHNVDFTQS
ncbi:Pectin acetylesterase 9 [Hibiscus syriacus]|uniref:Pectin acetylesterase n=1 Tax=Hibiscus syriacus TaxID=106335 RepID=A0A6A3BWW8_HIBSY|nr:Pectin acetylesterase 9 [Hibiscus syriacus]